MAASSAVARLVCLSITRFFSVRAGGGGGGGQAARRWGRRVQPLLGCAAQRGEARGWRRTQALSRRMRPTCELWQRADRRHEGAGVVAHDVVGVCQRVDVAPRLPVQLLNRLHGRCMRGVGGAQAGPGTAAAREAGQLTWAPSSRWPTPPSRQCIPVRHVHAQRAPGLLTQPLPQPSLTHVVEGTPLCGPHLLVLAQLHLHLLRNLGELLPAVTAPEKVGYGVGGWWGAPLGQSRALPCPKQAQKAAGPQPRLPGQAVP